MAKARHLEEFPNAVRGVHATGGGHLAVGYGGVMRVSLHVQNAALMMEKQHAH